jgi:hypothetical protein
MTAGGSPWKRVFEQEKSERKRNISVAAVVRIGRSAGPAPAAFKSVIPAWKRISGD